MSATSSSETWTSWAFDDEVAAPLDFNTGSVFGQICGCCTFDESVIGFHSIPDASGFFLVDGRPSADSPILEFPQDIWRGMIYCDGCHAVTRNPSDGTWDRTLSRAFRAAIQARDALWSGAETGPFPYPELITVHQAPAAA